MKDVTPDAITHTVLLGIEKKMTKAYEIATSADCPEETLDYLSDATAMANLLRGLLAQADPSAP